MIDANRLTTMKSNAVQFLLLMMLGAASIAEESATVAAIAEDTGDREPLLTVVPVYPEKARRARLEGEVQVCFNVSRDGRTSRVAVRKSTNRVFERPSRNAVKASTYHPLAADKKLSGIKTCRTFRFHLTPVAIEVPKKAAG
jgi:TonB family protein